MLESYMKKLLTKKGKMPVYKPLDYANSSSIVLSTKELGLFKMAMREVINKISDHLNVKHYICPMVIEELEKFIKVINIHRGSERKEDKLLLQKSTAILKQFRTFGKYAKTNLNSSEFWSYDLGSRKAVNREKIAFIEYVIANVDKYFKKGDILYMYIQEEVHIKGLTAVHFIQKVVVVEQIKVSATERDDAFIKVVPVITEGLPPYKKEMNMSKFIYKKEDVITVPRSALRHLSIRLISPAFKYKNERA